MYVAHALPRAPVMAHCRASPAPGFWRIGPRPTRLHARRFQLSGMGQSVENDRVVRAGGAPKRRKRGVWTTSSWVPYPYCRQHVHGSDEGHHHERQRQASSGNAGREDRGFLLLPRCAIIQGKRPRLPLTAFSPPCFRVAPALPRADLTGAIVGGIIGGLAFIALVAMWRFSVTKTGPFAEGMTFMTWVTCKGPHSVVVGAK